MTEPGNGSAKPPSERERWDTETQLRRQELGLKERALRGRGRGPVVAALVLIAVAIFAHAGVLLLGQRAIQTRAAADRLAASAAPSGTTPQTAPRDVATPPTPQAAPRDVANCPPASASPDLGLQWLDARCQYRRPLNDGFDGPVETITLTPGTLVDRYGLPTGWYLSPVGMPYAARALPFDAAKIDYYRYEVVVAFDVRAGKIVPWFDQPGGGTQFQTNKPIRQLLIDGNLKEVLRVPP